jgi:hypothetical protein
MIIFPRPDVAVVGLTATPTDTYVGNSVKITVAVLNDYHLPQSFNVTIYSNSNVLQTLTVANLDPYAEESFTYIWDTYTFSEGNYIMKAYAWPVPGETDTADNTYIGGTVHITQRVSPAHDVAITRNEQSKDVVGVGYSCSITITVQNQGDYAETFDVSIYANEEIIVTFVNVTLASGNSTTFTFEWIPLGSVKGNYVMWACAWPVLGETDTLDNNSTSGWMVVTIPGDVGGDLENGHYDVDLYDAVKLLACYGARQGDSNYDPNCDIDNDGRVFLFDAVILLSHYGQKYP